MNDYGVQINNLRDEIDKLRMQLNKLAEACKVSIDYVPHSYEINPLSDEEDEGVGNV